MSDPTATPRTLGQIAFDAYRHGGDTPCFTYDNKPIPPWEEVSENTRARWERGAEYVARQAEQNTLQRLADADPAFEKALARWHNICREHNGPVNLRVLLNYYELEKRSSRVSGAKEGT